MRPIYTEINVENIKKMKFSFNKKICKNYFLSNKNTKAVAKVSGINEPLSTKETFA